jgi:hypothetical protein
MRASIKLVIAAGAEMMEMVFGFLEIYSHRSLIFLKNQFIASTLLYRIQSNNIDRLTLPSLIKEI